MDNTDELKQAMLKHGLRRQDVADLTGYSKASVDRWLRDPDNHRFLPIPDRALDLMKLRMQGLNC